MPTAEQVLAAARSQIGTVEDSQGRQKYGAFYGANGVAWCAEFQWWAFNQVPGAAALIPKTAYTPTFYDWFRGRGRASSAPQPGALVFYNWPDSVNRIQHVGIVETFDDVSITTIEGNTTSGVAGNQSAGGGVWRRRRARDASIVGYGHPAYTVAPTTPPPAAPPRAPVQEDPFMALTDAQQQQLFDQVAALGSGVAMLVQQISGDEDAAGPDGFGWPTLRIDGGPDLTMVDLARSSDRELNSRLGLGDRPGPETDTLFGHVLSMRAELRKATDDLTSRLARVESALVTGGVDPALIQSAFAAAFGDGLQITGTAVPARTPA